MTSVAVCVPTIPTRVALLQRALASVDAQTRPADQRCVVADHDGDGASVTRNETWQLADTEWVAFLDDDDTFAPRHLELLLAHAEETGADLVYPWFWIKNAVGDDVTARDPLRIVVGGHAVSPFGSEFGDDHAHELMTRSNFIPVTVLVRRTLVAEVGGFPQTRTSEWPEHCCEDWGLWRKLIDAGAVFSHLPERTWHWWWHGRNTSGQPWRTRRTGRTRG